MRFQEPIRVTLLILTSIALVLGNGCRSGMNYGPSAWKPNLPSLAFWKKEADSVPKPPAVHFDPTPAGAETEVAAKTGATKNTAADLQNSLDKLAKSDTTDSKKSETKPAGQVAIQPEKSSVQPLRTPYQLSLGADKKADSPIDPATSKQPAGLTNKPGQSEFKLPESFKPNASNPLPAGAQTADQARAQFNSDMQNLRSTAKSNAGVAGSNVGNNVAALTEKSEDKSAAVSTQTANQFASVERKLSDEQRRLEAEVAKAKQDIADLKRQLMTNSQMLAPIGSTQAGREPSGTLATQSMGSQALGSKNQVASNPEFQPAMGLTPNPINSDAAKMERGRDQVTASQGGFAPLRPNTSGTASAAPSAASPAAAQYPSTSLGGFSAAFNSATPKPDTNIQPAALQSPLGSNGGNVDNSQEFGSATADIEIPESILRGTGSFSPGSVNRLRGN